MLADKGEFLAAGQCRLAANGIAESFRMLLAPVGEITVVVAVVVAILAPKKHQPIRIINYHKTRQDKTRHLVK